MAKQIDVSLAIVSYFNSSDIQIAVKSIEEFTEAAIQKQIMIIDNANEPEAFQELCDLYADVTYINSGENLGYARGNNSVIPMLNSRYHAITNPDVVFTEDSLSRIIEYMDANPDVGMVIPKIVGEDGEILPVYRTDLTVFDMFIRKYCRGLFKKRMAKHTMSDQDYSAPFQVPFGQGSFLVIRTELFKELKGFDENYFLYVEDADLCKRVNQVSKLMYFPGTSLIHKWKRASKSDKKLLKAHIKSTKYYFKKWGWKLF